MDFLANGQFTIRVSTSFAKVMPVNLQITSTETDGNAANNTATVNVQGIGRVFLPLITRAP
jgi:hypothetical protein